MDSTLGVALKGYSYFRKRFEEQQTDVLQTSLFFKKAVVMKGEEAARVFYDREKFKREKATPKCSTCFSCRLNF